MSDTNNASFKRSPQQFLRDNDVRTDGRLIEILRSPDGAAHEFTLKKNSVKDKYLTLGIYGQGVLGNVQKSKHSHPLKAYWLPNINDQAVALELNRAADYLFTPELTGCTFAYETGLKPTVMHIGGDIEDRDVPNHLGQLRNAHHFGPGDQDAIKNQVLLDKGINASTVDVVYASNVIGVRNNMLWKFYVQTRCIIANESTLEVTTVFKVTELP